MRGFQNSIRSPGFRDKRFCARVSWNCYQIGAVVDGWLMPSICEGRSKQRPMVSIKRAWWA
jgi:hypothetical protein